MKLWKQTLLTVFALFVIITGVLYVSCEKDPCSGLSCQNGGSCSQGLCNCPTGYEGTLCQARSITRYLGVYGGFTTCNNNSGAPGAPVIDTAWVYAGNLGINSVKLVQYTNPTDTLQGTVSFNQSTYYIVVPDSTALNYLKTFTITLQNDNKLTISTYELNEQFPKDTMQNNCTFVGFD